MNRPNLQIAALVGVVLFITLNLGLGRLPLVGADEPRYARIGQEMFQSGDYVTPTLTGRPWLEKPPLLFWMEAAVLHCFSPSEWSARLPISLLAILTALGCGRILGSMAGFRVGVLATLTIATTPLFFVFSRAASTDLPLSACLTLAMLSAYRAHQTLRLGWALLAGLTLALAVLAKGPVALILLAGVALSYWTVTGASLWSLRQGAAATAVFAAVCLPWFLLVWAANGHDFVATFWLNHHLARFVTDVHHHSQPIWFYIPILLVGCAPWIFFAGLGGWRHWRGAPDLSRESRRLELFLWLWIAVPFVFFSLSRSKLPGYVLPVAPPVALLAAIELDRFLAGDVLSTRLVRRLMPPLALGGLLMAVVCAIAMAQVYESAGMGIALALPWLLLTCGMWWARSRSGALVPVLVLSLTLLAGVAFSVVAPAIGVFHSSKRLMESVGSSLSAREPLVFYRFFHHTALYYSDYNALPEPIGEIETLRAYMRSNRQERYWVLTQRGGLEELQSAFDTRQRREGNQFLVEVKRPSDP